MSSSESNQCRSDSPNKQWQPPVESASINNTLDQKQLDAELETDEFWEPSPPSHSQSKESSNPTKPSKTPISQMGFAASKVEIDQDVDPVFVADNTLNVSARIDPSISQQIESYSRLRNNSGVMLPPFTKQRAKLHRLAPGHTGFYWTILKSAKAQDDAYQKLVAARHTITVLDKSHYRLDTYLKASDVEKHSRCSNCLKPKKKAKRDPVCQCHVDEKPIAKGPKKGTYACCGKIYGCLKTSHHWDTKNEVFSERFNSWIKTSTGMTTKSIRKAMVFDCEMVSLEDGVSELARLCAVDYLTGEVLIDVYVDPVRPVRDWLTKYSGITPEDVEQARQNKSCLPNWRAARDALLHFVNAQTILIGCALQNDLNIMRLVHTNIVDATILAQQRVGFPYNRAWGLQVLCKTILDLDVQQSKTHGHDPLEDCMATREVVLWMTQNKPRFESWAALKRVEEDKRHQEEKCKAAERLEKAYEERTTAENAHRKANGLPDAYTAHLMEEYGWNPDACREDDGDVPVLHPADQSVTGGESSW